MPISQDARRIQRASPTPIHTTTSPSQQALIWQKSLIGTAVAKVDTDKNLYTQTIPVNRKVLVVGAGIAGIQAALDVADAGFPVTLVERNPSIGGKMVKFDKTFPTMDCSACICTPKMSEAGNHPNITIKTLSEVEKVTGYIGNFEATIRERAKYIDYDLCTGCGACETKCPSKTTNEFDEGLSLRKAIYKPFAQAVPSKPTIDPNSCRKLTEGKCGVCAKICPTGAIRYDDTDRTTTETFGAIILATGYDLIDWTKLYGEYGGGNYPDVITGSLHSNSNIPEQNTVNIRWLCGNVSFLNRNGCLQRIETCLYLTTNPSTRKINAIVECRRFIDGSGEKPLHSQWRTSTVHIARKTKQFL